jgi:hypothetical protein
MRIVKRSVGGFTGPAGADTRTLDVDALPADRAAEIRGLVTAAGFDSLPPKLLKTSPQPWDFVHSLEVEHEGRVHAVQYHDECAPEGLRRLADAVDAQSLPRA